MHCIFWWDVISLVNLLAIVNQPYCYYIILQLASNPMSNMMILHKAIRDPTRMQCLEVPHCGGLVKDFQIKVVWPLD